MKNLTKILILIIAFSCGTQKKVNSVANNISDSPQAENFQKFLKNFSLNKDFQLSRIEFPLPDCKYVGTYATPCTEVQKEDWKHLVLNDTTKFQVMFYNDSYDSEFNLDKYERTLGKVSSNRSDCLYYQFLLEKSKWKLIKITKCSK